MAHIYSSIIEPILAPSITVWYAAATAKDKSRLQHVIRSAEMVIGCNLASLQDLYVSRILKQAGKIVAVPSRPGHKLFEALPVWKEAALSSFFPLAIRLLNKA